MITHTLGFPRIGIRRELKRVTERYWQGAASEGELSATARELRLRHWSVQAQAGIDLLPVGDFSLYDRMLDTIALFGAVPERYDWDGGPVNLTTYFAMARGEADVTPMEMTKWFDTNYHYIVPEFTPETRLRLLPQTLLAEIREAEAARFHVKPCLIGPITFMYLGKASGSFERGTLLDPLLACWEELLGLLPEGGWIQVEEPLLALDCPDGTADRFREAYARLAAAAEPRGQKILLTPYFGRLGENLDLALSLPVAGVHLDAVYGAADLDRAIPLAKRNGRVLSLGIVSGRNIWRADLDTASQTLRGAVKVLGADGVLAGTSCSLLHVPVDLSEEHRLDSEVRSWMAFAVQKCEELCAAADLADPGEAGDERLEAARTRAAENRDALAARQASPRVVNDGVRARVRGLTEEMAHRESPFAQRKELQRRRFGLPELPTTTIGSFPQTRELRRTRAQFRRGEIDEGTYRAAMEGYIDDCIERQEALGLDVLVHGEPERNDMVEYFGEQMDGYAFTQNGWVQSYGTRCVKPPVLYGDVARPAPMTVDWITYAAGRSEKPVKGMLTGPLTMLAWSFVRDDQPAEATCRQLALAIRDEVADLEAAGVGIIQIDEPALREKLPLRREDHDGYLNWATYCFRLATSGVEDATQIHTHMCYSEFNEIIAHIARMDADVLSIEASRSAMELLGVFRDFRYPAEIGPGVYDIHSPRVPSTAEMTELIRKALAVIPREHLWVNPDCGLKTRGWDETSASLGNMVAAARAVRSELAVEA